MGVMGVMQVFVKICIARLGAIIYNIARGYLGMAQS